MDLLMKLVLDGRIMDCVTKRDLFERAEDF